MAMNKYPITDVPMLALHNEMDELVFAKLEDPSAVESVLKKEPDGYIYTVRLKKKHED